MVDVEVDGSDGDGRIVHQAVGEAEHAVEDVGALGDGVDEEVGRTDAFRERVDAVGVPKRFVAKTRIGVHLDFDVRKLPVAEFGVDFDVGEVALADGHHRQ